MGVRGAALWCSVVVGGVVVIASSGACGALGGGCSDGRIEAAFGEIELSCAPNDLTAVIASGPCSMPDAGLEYYTGAGSHRSVSIRANRAGDCRVELVFASGFTYATDITFTTQNSGTPECPGCPDYYAPMGGIRVVNNPPETCLPADAGDNDAGRDADAQP